MASLSFLQLPGFAADCRRLAVGLEAMRQIELLILTNGPEHGAVVSGTGGVRKFRAPREGSGKSGGVRVFYIMVRFDLVLFIMMFAKNEKQNISAAKRIALKAVAERARKFPWR